MRLRLVLPALLLAYVTWHGFWTVFHWDGSEATARIAGLPLLLPGLVATAVVTWRARVESNRQHQRGWTLLAVALGIYSAGLALWGSHTVLYTQIPFPTVADLAFLVFPWLVFLALTQLTGSLLNPASRARVTLNTLIMLCSLGLIEWSLLLSHAVVRATGPLEILATIMYPLGDLVMLGGVAFTLQHAWDQQRRRFLLPLLLAVSLFFIGNLIYSVQIVTGTYRAASPLDLSWSLGLAVFALAALSPLGTSVVPAVVQARGERLSSRVILVLKLAAFTSLIPLLLRAETRLLDALVVVVLLLGLGVLIYLRQQLDTRENLRLNHDLTVANSHLHERVEQAVNALEERNADLARQTLQLAHRNQEIQSSSDLADLLQACLSFDEAREVLVNAATRLFPGTRGSVAIINPSRNLIETFASWDEGATGTVGEAFAPQNCWALRRGQAHLLECDGQRLSVACQQLPHVPRVYLCLPLVAQGETVGVLRIIGETAGAPSVKDLHDAAQTMVRPVALALANLQLRDTLRQQSVRDPLTGLHNRRYLEETLEREIRRAQRVHEPLSVLVLDVDHFKKFNDRFGHDAGDLVLQDLARVMRRVFREEDVVCRYGGEEFVVVLLNTSDDHALLRAEQLRKAVQRQYLSFRGQELPTVTVSVGVATLSGERDKPEALISAADGALYQAKREGRNRVAMARKVVAPD